MFENPQSVRVLRMEVVLMIKIKKSMCVCLIVVQMAIMICSYFLYGWNVSDSVTGIICIGSGYTFFSLILAWIDTTRDNNTQ